MWVGGAEFNSRSEAEAEIVVHIKPMPEFRIECWVKLGYSQYYFLLDRITKHIIIFQLNEVFKRWSLNRK
jgi:hypothetical protein